MKTLNFHITSFLLLLVLSSACSPEAEKNLSGNNVDSLVVFLVRHGEKVDQSRDPELSPAGYVRAATLAQTLHSAEIEYVHSTDFIRTRKTAEPLAAINALKIDIYDPSDLRALAEEIRKKGGRHLVVGHSNTTPRMVELLGGEPGLDIDENDEYDRLYMLTVSSEGEVGTVLLRYGVAYNFK
ncbi:MAG: histidine phosphatase family protein [Bacteroidota bacterium]